MVAYTGHDSWAGVAHDISNEAYTENRCSGSDTRPTVALGDSSVLRGSTLLLPPMSRRVTQEGNTLLSSAGLTKVGAGRNPGPLDGSKSGVQKAPWGTAQMKVPCERGRLAPGL